MLFLKLPAAPPAVVFFFFLSTFQQFGQTLKNTFAVASSFKISTDTLTYRISMAAVIIAISGIFKQLEQAFKNTLATF